MEQDYTLLLQRLEAAETRAKNAHRRLQVIGTLAVTATAAAIFINILPRAQAQITGKPVSSDILTRLAALEAKTAHITSTDRDVTISGANVHIVDGSGKTGSSSSLGNLIVGYNAPRGSGDLRTGSHNIVVGDGQNYSAFGGLVAGYSNSIVKPYATVTGGFNNVASGTSSSISGGSRNTTYGDASAVNGGSGNTAAFSNSSMPFDYLMGTVGLHDGQILDLQRSNASLTYQIGVVKTGLAQETTTRQTADTALQTQFTALQGQITGFTAGLTQETADRKAGDTALQTQFTGLQAQITGFSTGLAQEVTDRTTAITDLQSQIDGLSISVFDLETKTQFISVDLPNKAMFVTGANLFLQSGSGATDDFGDLTGLGNLIIGYNEVGNVNGDFRTGSHNLVVGQNNSYSSYGGFVAGQSNTISGRFSVVSGGQKGVASGDRSSVSGGYNNMATKDLASVTGGINNIASGFYSSVLGGCANLADGFYTTVSGGVNNNANGQFSSVSGGNGNQAKGDSSSILGGNNVVITGQFNHFP